MPHLTDPIVLAVPVLAPLDPEACECCGEAAPTVVRGGDRLCRSCATDEDEAAALDWRVGRTPAWARPAAFRAGGAAVLGLCGCDGPHDAPDEAPCAACGGAL